MIDRRQILAAGSLGLGLARPGLLRAAAGSRTLVVLFTRTHNSRIGAQWVARRTGADLFEIRPRDPYPAEFDALVQQNRAEQARDHRPALLAPGPPTEGYDVIYLAHPIWSAAIPGPVKTWLAGHDLAGKRVVQMISHGGYGPGAAPDTLRALAPGATLAPPLIRQDELELRVLEEVEDWFAGAAP